jgi:hypothetical protein
VYFNNGSSEIPNRYVLLNKDQVKDFKEDQLDFCSKKIYQIVQKKDIYYNILNILGDRMQKNPNATISGRFIRTRTSRWFSNVRIN